MSGIVCAVRGGLASQPTITTAIALAQETGLPLYFLYVVNLDFLSHSPTSRVHTISQEMHEMGEFILLMAQETAARQAVSAEGVVRHGNVAEEVIRLCHELEADYLVLGKPKVEREDTVFTRELLHEFARRTEEQTGAAVVFAQGDVQ
ncbi:MAG: universal stress protein [Anaerolineae bacterium]|jgi:nucleotide-binding universal stress UspA family protein